MKTLQLCLSVPFLMSAIGSNCAIAQREPTEIPEEARKRLDYAIGEWEVLSRSYNARGEVMREVTGRDNNRYAIEGRVVEHTTEFPELGSLSKAWMFYNVREQKFYLTSVDQNGSLWVMSGGLDKYVLTSEPRKQPNGSELIIRFTHENIAPDSFEAQMESSRDGGKTWRKGYRQFLSRIKIDSDGETSGEP